MSEEHPVIGVAAVSLLFGVMLQIVPIPAVLADLRPDWLLLILVYWCLTTPSRFGLSLAFGLGLVLDTLTGALLGQHALSMLLVVFVALKFRLRIRVFPMAQMMIVVFVLLALYQFTLFWIDGVAGRSVDTAARWQPLVTGTAAWPVVFWLLNRARRDAGPQPVRLD